MTSTSTPPRRSGAALACLVAVATLVAGCGGSSSQNGSSGPSVAGTAQTRSATPGGAVCADIATLESAWRTLQQASPGAGGLRDLTTQLSAVRGALVRLRADAADLYAPQLDAVDKAASALADDLRGAASGSPTPGSLSGVPTAVRNLDRAVRDLVAAVQSSC